MPRNIKRYDNRKLYDLDAKRYVRLNELASMIRAGEEIVVTENATGADLTAETLTKILRDESGGSPLLNAETLHNLVRWGGQMLDKVLVRSAERVDPIPDLRRELAELRERVATMESLVSKLEEENRNGGNNDNERGGRDRPAKS